MLASYNKANCPAMMSHTRVQDIFIKVTTLLLLHATFCLLPILPFFLNHSLSRPSRCTAESHAFCFHLLLLLLRLLLLLALIFPSPLGTMPSFLQVRLWLFFFFFCMNFSQIWLVLLLVLAITNHFLKETILLLFFLRIFDKNI
jgi:hypothetical protein